MAVEILESATAAGFGAADALIAAKVTTVLPGGIKPQVAFEGAGILAYVFGRHVGLSPAMRDTILTASLTLLGSRAAKLALAGKLTQPSQWGSVGGEGEGGDGDGYSAGGGAPVALSGGRVYAGARNAPAVRVMGRGGSFALLPATSESGGVAG